MTEPTTGGSSKATFDAADEAADWRDRASFGWIGLCALLAGVAVRFSGLGAIGAWLSYGLWLVAAALTFIGWSRRRAARRLPNALEAAETPPEA